VDDVTSRFVSDLIGRLTGPLSFRLILQPMMAAFFAVRDGLKEEREGRPPYFWSLFTAPTAERRELLQEAWKAVVKVFVLAFVLDLVYQLIVIRWIYPFESLVVAIILAIVPYVLLRGVVNRIVRTWIHSKGHASR
jgi:hypothetical protein